MSLAVQSEKHTVRYVPGVYILPKYNDAIWQAPYPFNVYFANGRKPFLNVRSGIFVRTDCRPYACDVVL